MEISLSTEGLDKHENRTINYTPVVAGMKNEMG